MDGQRHIRIGRMKFIERSSASLVEKDVWFNDSDTSGPFPLSTFSAVWRPPLSPSIVLYPPHCPQNGFYQVELGKVGDLTLTR